MLLKLVPVFSNSLENESHVTSQTHSSAKILINDATVFFTSSYQLGCTYWKILTPLGGGRVFAKVMGFFSKFEKGEEKKRKL